MSIGFCEASRSKTAGFFAVPRAWPRCRGTTLRHGIHFVDFENLSQNRGVIRGNEFGFRLSALGTLLGVGISISLRAFAACGDSARATPEFRAAQACEQARAAHALGNATAEATAILSLQSTPYCLVRSPQGPNPSFDSQLCTDPNGFVCGDATGPHGRVMNSNCEFLHLDSAQAGRTPAWVADHCSAETQIATAFETYRKTAACQGLSARSCRQRFNIRNRDIIQRTEREAIYTPARLERVSSLFERVRSEYIQQIQQSSRIPAARKAELIQKLQSTVLLTSPAQRDALLDSNSPHAECLNSTQGQPRTGAYNESLVSGGRITNTVVICAGFMTNLEQMNPYLLMEILGHEISHSINPCALEKIASIERHQPEPNAANPVFPGLLECLRGGATPNGCGAGAILHCTTPAGIREECGSSHSCRREAAQIPNCDHGGPGHTHRVGPVVGSGDYRDRSANLEQSGESFGDFMGAEIVGRIMARDSATPPGFPSAQGKRDALIAISSAYSRLHGVCMNTNTPDEHPPGFIRVNRLIMGSRSFREAIGCGSSGAPQTPGAGATCQGF